MKRLMILAAVLLLAAPALAEDEWHIETVDSAGNVGMWTSLALDSSGRPHITYFDWGNNNLKRARWDGSAWHI